MKDMMTIIEPSESDLHTYSMRELYLATKEIKPVDWRKHNLTVLRDGHLENGIRVHVVQEKLEKEPVIVDSAIIICLESVQYP